MQHVAIGIDGTSKQNESTSHLTPPPLQKLGALQNDNDYAEDDVWTKKNSQKVSSFADCLENV